jgi:hypothetical protein
VVPEIRIRLVSGIRSIFIPDEVCYRQGTTGDGFKPIFDVMDTAGTAANGKPNRDAFYTNRSSAQLVSQKRCGMSLIEDLLLTLPDAPITDVVIGLHWTAVAAEVDGELRCGLASTLAGSHEHGGEPDVPEAGSLQDRPGRALAELARDREHPIRCSIGVAAINAMLPPLPPGMFQDGNAEEMIVQYGAGKRVVLIGHFPFVPGLSAKVGELSVLSLNPRHGDLPASAAPQVIPSADLVAITGMTLINHTLESLLELCSRQALVMILGPSTPLSPVLFDHGVDLLSGSLVTDRNAVMQVAGQGGNFRQIHRAGVRLVTVERPGWREGKIPS